jgi:hypothetical protein
LLSSEKKSNVLQLKCVITVPAHVERFVLTLIFRIVMISEAGIKLNTRVEKGSSLTETGTGLAKLPGAAYS